MRRGLQGGRERRDEPTSVSRDVDASVAWSARLLYPRRVEEGARRAMFIRVTSPEMLDTQRVEVQLGDARVDAAWLSDVPSHSREVVVQLGDDLPARPGRVIVHVGGTELYAGRLAVRR